MALTVKQVAEMSGISVRTLHHYDGIGLLKPDHVGANGYRYYERKELLRLQQILFYRDLGLPLEEIGRTIDDPGFDPVAALKRHRKRLEDEIGRHRDLIRTIDTTIAELSGRTDMQNTNPFAGFSPEKQQAYEEELADRYGNFAKSRIAESKAKIGKLSKDQMAAINAEGHDVNLGLAAEIEAGSEPGSATVQALIARHHKWVSNFWTPNAEAYEGLGKLYLEHADFRAFYDKYDARLADFLAEAMAIYARENLG